MFLHCYTSLTWGFASKWYQFFTESLFMANPLLKEDWHFQLCLVFPIVTAYCFHRNPSKCFNRTWFKKEFCWHIYTARFLKTWLMSPQYSLLLKNKSKDVQNIHAAATALSLSISRTLEFVSLFYFFPPHHPSILLSFCPWKPFST